MGSYPHVRKRILLTANPGLCLFAVYMWPKCYFILGALVFLNVKSQKYRKRGLL